MPISGPQSILRESLLSHGRRGGQNYCGPEVSRLRPSGHAFLPSIASRKLYIHTALFQPTVHPELLQWHARLNSRRDLMSHPEELRRELTDSAKDLLVRGVVTSDEWLELCDLVTGAYSFAIEQRAAELFHQSSAYEVFDSSWRKVGTATRGVLLFAGADWPLLIRYGEEGQLQAFSGTGFTFLAGSLQGLALTMENGRRFTLVEIGRYLKGGVYVEVITDPDDFLLVLHAAAAAREDGDLARARHLLQRARVSPFRVCPTCRANFATLDECTRCAGLGFIRVAV